MSEFTSLRQMATLSGEHGLPVHMRATEVIALVERVETAERNAQRVAEQHIANGNAGAIDMSVPKAGSSDALDSGAAITLLRHAAKRVGLIFEEEDARYADLADRNNLTEYGKDHRRSDKRWGERIQSALEGMALKANQLDVAAAQGLTQEDRDARDGARGFDAWWLTTHDGVPEPRDVDWLEYTHCQSAWSAALVLADKARDFRATPCYEKMVGGSDVCATCEAHCVVIEDYASAMPLRGQIAETIDKAAQEWTYKIGPHLPQAECTRSALLLHQAAAVQVLFDKVAS